MEINCACKFYWFLICCVFTLNSNLGLIVARVGEEVGPGQVGGGKGAKWGGGGMPFQSSDGRGGDAA